MPDDGTLDVRCGRCGRWVVVRLVERLGMRTADGSLYTTEPPSGVFVAGVDAGRGGRAAVTPRGRS